MTALNKTRFLILVNSLFILSAVLVYTYYYHPTLFEGIWNTNMTSEFANVSQTMEQLTEELKQNPLDPNSFARPSEAKVTHLDLRLSVNFDKQILDGYVILTVKKEDPDAKFVLLDTMDLMIFGVYHLINDDKNKQKIPYKLHTPVPEFGSKLAVDIGQIECDINSELKLHIDYRTNSTSRALMWMNPEQTDGKQHPFMFSQGQAINMRAMVPCQDTPSVKATYSAEIHAPRLLQVLMSAKIIKEPTLSSDGETRTHYFNQKVPIPSYLIALAVGDLVSKKIGNISHVWAEPGVIEAAAWEFAEIDKLLNAAEHFAGPYVWEIYDVLVLPPSFPYGGMENPCLTFVTPTLLAGDRSLVNVVAHEISHSWTGNLVTNANYGHFWLNEGFTMFLERKIDGYTEDGEKSRQFSALEGLNDLRNTVQYYGDDSPFTKLLIDVRGINPDDVFSTIPYEKGHTFLFYLEQKLGGPSVFEPFLKSYIKHFAYKSIITNDFQTYLLSYFEKDPEKHKILKDLDWDSWLNKPGMPPVIPDYDRTLLMASVDLATKWLNIPLDQIKPSEFPLAEFKQLNSLQQKLFFVQLCNRMNESTTGSFVDKMSTLHQTYEMDNVKNCEVKHAWIMLGLQSHYEGIIQQAVDFVSTYGRMKYIKPIYRSMYKWPQTKQLALDTFERNKPKMMKVAIDTVQRDLKD